MFTRVKLCQAYFRRCFAYTSALKVDEDEFLMKRLLLKILP